MWTGLAQVHYWCGSAELGVVKLVMEKQISMAWLDSKMQVEKQHYLKVTQSDTNSPAIDPPFMKVLMSLQLSK